MARFRTLVLLGLASCTPPTPVARPTPQTEVRASFDHTWNALLDYLVTSKVPIKTVEKASGVATTETVPIDKWDAVKLANSAQCELKLTPDSVSLAFVVRGDSTQSFVRATALFRDATGDECFSTWALEQSWENEVRRSAELAQTRTPQP